MAVINTQILDLVPSEKVLGLTVNLYIEEKNELLDSGLAARSEEVDKVASGGPRKGGIPFLEPLNTDSVNVGTDDLNEFGGVGKMTAEEFSVIRHDLNWQWGFSDLARMVTRYNAEGGIPAGIAAFWNAIYKKIAAQSMKGVLASNADLTYGDGTDPFSLKMVAYAAATAGVHADQFDTLIVSPNRKAQMIVDNENAYVPKSETKTNFDEWAGKKLIVSTVFGDDTTILARSGVLAFGLGTVDTPIEVERIARGGKGAGGGILISRQSPIIHVQGCDYKGPTAPEITPAAGVDPVLSLASSWAVAEGFPLEMVGLRAIKHLA